MKPERLFVHPESIVSLLVRYARLSFRVSDIIGPGTLKAQSFIFQ